MLERHSSQVQDLKNHLATLVTDDLSIAARALRLSLQAIGHVPNYLCRCSKSFVRRWPNLPRGTSVLIGLRHGGEAEDVRHVINSDLQDFLALLLASGQFKADVWSHVHPTLVHLYTPIPA